MPNPANIHTTGYRPAGQGRPHPPYCPGPEPMAQETGEPDDFSQRVLRQENPPLRIQPSRKCKARTKPTKLEQGLCDLTPEDRQLLLRQSQAIALTSERHPAFEERPPQALSKDTDFRCPLNTDSKPPNLARRFFRNFFQMVTGNRSVIRA